MHHYALEKVIKKKIARFIISNDLKNKLLLLSSKALFAFLLEVISVNFLFCSNYRENLELFIQYFRL